MRFFFFFFVDFFFLYTNDLDFVIIYFIVSFFY